MKIKKTYSGVVPNGKVLNSENASLQDTYSCDYLNRTIPDTKDLGEIIVDDIHCKNIIATDIKSQTINGLTITVNLDKTVTIKGTATSDTNIILNNTTYNTTNKIPAGTYTLSGGCQTFIEEGNNQGWWRSETKTFNTDTMLSSLGFYFYVSNGSTVDKTIYLQLEKGPVATNYVPHKKYAINELIKTKTYTNELVANSNVSPFNSMCAQNISDINGIIIQIDARNSWNAPLLATKVGDNVNVVGNMSTGAGANVYITVTYIEM